MNPPNTVHYHNFLLHLKIVSMLATSEHGKIKSSMLIDAGLMAQTLTEKMSHQVLPLPEKEFQFEIDQGAFRYACIALEEIIQEINPRDLEIANVRLFNEKSNARTLDQLGSKFSLTRERIRQIQNRINQRINYKIGTELGLLALHAKLCIGHVVKEEQFDEKLKELHPSEGFDSSGVRIRHLVKENMNYEECNGICLSSSAVGVVSEINKVATRISDEIGLVDEVNLKAKFDGSDWLPNWKLLCQAAGLKLICNQLSFKESQVARVKAAMLDIGTPATVEELAKAAGFSTDQPVRNIVSNYSQFVRTDNLHWTPNETVDKVYYGISHTIKQRIVQEGGSTSLSRLIQELPQQCGVRKESVASYVRTSQYKIEGDTVRLADESDLELKPLDEVINGRDSRGFPYWSFKMQERYFSGYSVLRVPAEIARELSCPANSSIDLEISIPAGFEPLSLIWKLDSLTEASLGRLRKPLKHIKANTGEPVYIVILPSKAVEVRTKIN